MGFNSVFKGLSLHFECHWRQLDWRAGLWKWCRKLTNFTVQYVLRRKYGHSQVCMSDICFMLHVQWRVCEENVLHERMNFAFHTHTHTHTHICIWKTIFRVNNIFFKCHSYLLCLWSYLCEPCVRNDSVWGSWGVTPLVLKFGMSCE